MSTLKDKMKLLKADIRVWNKEVFDCMESNKKTIVAEIEDLDDNDVLEENGKMRRMELFSQLGLVEKKLDSIYRQKARGNWIKYGDMNSKFFYNAIRWRRLKNEAKGVEIGGLWCEELKVVHREAKSLFEKRFTATQDYDVNLGSVDFKSLSPKVSMNMITSFFEEEVKDAMWQCGGSKSPGLDGFNFNFIKSCWDVIKSDVMAAVHFFHATGTFPKGCNASFIALVLKVRDPSSLDQFRPISLVGVIYKIITKVLSRRMKKVMSMIIDDCQSAFLSERGLTDSVVMVNEIFEEIKLNRRSGVCFKVDFEKAYDSVRWSFLFDMLRRLGFHDKWILWVKGCMVSSSMSVLINGSPTEEFKPSRGLRQGDPLAPFLILVVAEGLVGLVRQALGMNVLRGIKVGRNSIECCLLQFADDTLFMCEDSFSNIFAIKAILRCYEILFGLKVNFHKSKLVGISVDSYALSTYAKTLNCNTMRLAFKYLGVEVGGNPRKKQFWEPVIKKIESKLSSWKGRFSSMAGRICLLKSVFTAIPLFYLSVFKAPTTVHDSICSLQRKFLWAWGSENRTISWVTWKNVCMPQEEGGLGIKETRCFNAALLAKWKWRIMSNEGGKMKEILGSKYGIEIEREERQGRDTNHGGGRT